MSTYDASATITASSSASCEIRWNASATVTAQATVSCAASATSNVVVLVSPGATVTCSALRLVEVAKTKGYLWDIHQFVGSAAYSQRYITGWRVSMYDTTQFATITETSNPTLVV